MALSNITDLRSSVNHSISLPSYPKYTYRDIPVLTTEMLAPRMTLLLSRYVKTLPTTENDSLKGSTFFLYQVKISRIFVCESKFSTRKFHPRFVC